MDPPVGAIRRATHASYSGSTTLAPNSSLEQILLEYSNTSLGVLWELNTEILVACFNFMFQIVLSYRTM